MAKRPTPAVAQPTTAASSAIPAKRNLPPWLDAIARHRSLLVPLAFIALMTVLLVPIPTWLMDVLIVLNISLSVVILLTTISMNHPLDFSVFPSLLLATTLFRLVLNIASTRLILTADAASPADAAASAGHVIMAFGNFVAGNSLFVGVVIFLIIVIVQFVVITKGATRISEVAARFTLDAMPGKQMAIDSDLNAGIITEPEARKRREFIRQEADFFGAMDGASKFVRGDAVAGIIITVVNVIGGFAVGTIVKGWDAGAVAQAYTTLTIGDGLTSQLSAFLISVAAALIVTRSGAKEDLGNQVADQLISQPRGLAITAGFLMVLTVTPLPKLPLIAGAIVLGGIAFFMRRQARDVATAEKSAAEETATAKRAEPPPIENVLKVDTLELEVGYGLVPLVDAAQGGDLLERISAIRRQLAADLGLVLPPVRIRDNVQLPTDEYRLKIRGQTVAQGQVRPGRLMAMDSGIASGPISGEETQEPAFGLRAWWIDPAQRPRAETMNYTVVEPTSVLATHLTETARRHAAELLTRGEVANLVEQLKTRSPKLVEEAIPALVKLGDLQKIMQNLLRERVSIRDVETIVETLADWAGKTKDLDVLTEYVRHALRRAISLSHAQAGESTGKPHLACVTLDPTLEDQIAGYIERGPAGTSLSMPARVATAVSGQIAGALKTLTAAGHPPVILASPGVRAVVRQIIEPTVPTAIVLGYNEIIPEVEVEAVALAGMPETRAAQPTAAA